MVRGSDLAEIEIDLAHHRTDTASSLGDAKRVHAINVDKEKSSASMQRMSELMAQHKAQLWINHAKPQSATMKHAPDFYR